MDNRKHHLAGLILPRSDELDRRYCSLIGLGDGMFGFCGGIPITILVWGAGGGSRPGMFGDGAAGGFASYSGSIPYGAVLTLTLIVGAPGENSPKEWGGGGGGGYSGVFEGTVVSQASALVIAGAGGGGGDEWPDAGGGSTGKTGQPYSGGPLKGGSSLDGTLVARGGYPGGGDGYGVEGSRGGGGGGGGYEGGAAGHIESGMQSGYGGSCYTRSGIIMPGETVTPGNVSASERGNAGNPQAAGKVVIYVNAKLFMALSTPQTQIVTITGA